LFFSIVIIAYLLYIPQEKSIIDQELKVGDIVKEDIIIKKDITIEDKEITELNRKKAIDKVIPIYEYYSDEKGSIQNLINDWFKLIRQSKRKYIKNPKELNNIKKSIESNFGIKIGDEKLRKILTTRTLNKINLNKLFTFTAGIESTGILASKAGIRKSKTGTIKIVYKNQDPRVIQVEKLYDLKDVENALNIFLKEQKFSTSEIEFISSILMEFVDVNISYSNTLTQQEENNVAAQINPVIIKLKSGKIISRKGDELQPEDLRLIKLVAIEEEIREQKLSNFYLILVILVFMFLFINKFFTVWKSTDLNKDKLFLVTGATIFISAAVYRLSIFLFPLILKNVSLDINYPYSSLYLAIPFGFSALIIAFTFNLQSAVIYSFINSIISGIICDWNFKIVLYVLIGNLVISYGIEFYQRLKRSPILKASIFWLLPFNLIWISLLNLTESSLDMSIMLFSLALGCFSAILAPLLATFIIPLWESIFNLYTDLKLIELNNLNLPIFREMLEKAPGTYHHSQMVATLSETAALDLGLSPLLLSAMALYHDIGKIENPQFFTENNSVYPDDPHNKLNPQDSAKMIINHISDGIERSKKLKLPGMVASAINQHHGTKLVRFFYEKAVEAKDIKTDDLDEKVFRYPGDKPQNIENAIIMIADQVEAASKSLAAPTDEEIRNIIQKIIDSDIEEKQFDECEGLTFKSLNIIANGFLKKLSSIYHMRVSYPGFDFKEQNDQNHK
jgi:putative nucleotidyltransferase with HDIG domain